MARTQRTFWAIGAGMACICAAWMSLPSFAPPTPQGTPGSVEGTGPGTSTSGGQVPGPKPTNSASATEGTFVPSNSYLHQSGGSLFDANSQPVYLHGIGWYGFDSGTMLDTASIASRLGSDVVTIMQRMHMMGFNTVNMGISFSQLYQTNGNVVMNPTTAVINPCPGSSSQNDIISSVTFPGFEPAPNTPLLNNVPAAVDNYCNDYLPDLGEPVIARLAAIVDIFTRNGMYVLLQENIDQDAALTTDAATFAVQWQKFAQDLVYYGGTFEGVQEPNCAINPNGVALKLCHNVVFGLASNVERLATTLTWEPNNTYRNVGLHQLVSATLPSVAPVMPRAMFLVSGAYQFGLSTSLNAGVDSRTTGFPSYAGPSNVASATDFFEEVLNGPYESQLLFGFNAWGPSFDTYLSGFATKMYVKLESDFNNSFGQLPTLGVYDGMGTAHKFPSMPIAFGANPSDPNDNLFLAAMQSYMTNYNMQNFIWWCWGTSGTHSALVVDTSYVTLDGNIVAYLQALGLTPAR